MMGCIGKITGEYRQRMDDLLELYARPYQEEEPVICVDFEKQPAFATDPNVDFLTAWDALAGGLRIARGGCAEHFCGGGTQRRAAANHRDGELLTKVDFVDFMGRLVEKVYVARRKIHLLLDNLNTHFRHSFVEAPGASSGSRSLLARVEFHDTPKHAGWLTAC